jgi:hypothetical protein
LDQEWFTNAQPSLRQERGIEAGPQPLLNPIKNAFSDSWSAANRMNMGTLAAANEFFARLSSRPAVLPPYTQPKSTIQKLIRNTFLYGVLIAMGLFYGLSVALLPPILLMYFSLPIALIALAVVWALPERDDRAPTRMVQRLFVLLTLALMLWPDYLAMQIPGFAWISLRRLVAIGLAIVFLISLSSSPQLRTQIKSVVATNKGFWLLMAGYVAIQLLTIPMSDQPPRSFNLVFNQFFVWTLPLLVGAWYFSKVDNQLRWTKVFFGVAAVQLVIGTLEYFNGRLLWADHIPTFLQVQDEVISRILSGAWRDGKYRVTSTFSVSLSFAEYLACVVPFILWKIFNQKNMWKVVLWAAFDIALLTMIVLTRSRLGIVGWLTAHALFVFFWGVRRWARERSDIIGPAVSLFYPAMVAVFAVAMFTVDAVRVRTIGGGSTGFSDDGRKIQFEMFWPKLFDNPIGNGAGQSAVTLGYRQPGGLLTVDSYIITLGMDFGVVGILCFYGMLILAATACLKVYMDNRASDDGLALAAAAAIVSFGTTRLVLSQVDTVPILFLLLAFAMGVCYRHRLPAGSPAVGTPIFRSPQRIVPA